METEKTKPNKKNTPKTKTGKSNLKETENVGTEENKVMNNKKFHNSCPH